MKPSNLCLYLITFALLLCGCGVKPNTSVTPTVQPELIHNSLSFTLDPELGSGFEKMIIAESAAADQPYFGIFPEYTEITVDNYILQGTSLTPRLYLFPVARFSELLPDLLPGRLADLKTLIAEGDVTSNELPFLPVINSSQMFVSQLKVIPFKNGTGIRYITQFANGIVAVNNQELIYTFQGLTSDGEYWVAIILPISSSILPAGGETPPDGLSMEEFVASYQTYLADTSTALGAETTESFTPTITKLDSLVNSILVAPR